MNPIIMLLRRFGSTELENKQGNIIQQLFSSYLLHKANIEYEYLSPKIPSIESRIYEIRSQLSEY